MKRREFIRVLSVSLWLLFSCAAWAGSDIFGSLPGALTAATLKPAAGKWAAITLQVTPSSPLQGLELRFEAPDACALLQASSSRRTDVSLRAGQTTRFMTKARVKNAKPCKIVASIVQADGTNVRTGWIYAIVLNDAAPSHGPYNSGHDVAGQPTIDAVVR